MERRPILVLVTTPDATVASRLARDLVDRKLAACCNLISGIQSIYRWEGKTCEEPEILLVIKSTSDLFADLEIAVRESHPYDVPEIIALPIQHGSAPYLNWLVQSTGKE